MQNSKDEIEIKFSKKDIVYLSLIAVLVCIVALVAILVPRYYKLKQTTVPPLNNTPITDQYEKPPLVDENENLSDNNSSNNKDNFVNRNENDSSHANNNSDDSTLPNNPTDDNQNENQADSSSDNNDNYSADNTTNNESADSDNSSSGENTTLDDPKENESSNSNNDNANSSVDKESNNNKNDNLGDDPSNSPTDDSSNIDNDVIKTPEDDENNSADNPSGSNPSQDDEPESVITDPAYYTTKVMQILKDVGKPYSSSSKYLDADGNLNYSKLNPSDSQLEEMESSAKLLYDLFYNYQQQGITITSDFIKECDELISAIGSFTDCVNTVEDN